jgi:hypothetical protein
VTLTLPADSVAAPDRIVVLLTSRAPGRTPASPIGH